MEAESRSGAHKEGAAAVRMNRHGAAPSGLYSFVARQFRSLITPVMLGFAHPAALQMDAAAFTVTYPWAKPPVVGWASADQAWVPLHPLGAVKSAVMLLMRL